MADRKHSVRVRVLLSAATLVSSLLIYYGLPLDSIHVSSDALGLIMFLVGVAGLAWLVIYATRQYAAAPSDTGNRMAGALLIVYLVVVGFALIYFVIERSLPGQFVGLETRTDSLYYTVVTLGTVGFGDIVPVGHVARAATMVQIFFDLVLIGLLLTIAGSHVTRSLAARASSSDDAG